MRAGLSDCSRNCSFELWIGDATEIRTKRVRKQKTDRQDAQLLLRYVPKVVYTRGVLLHNGELIIPYGMADHATGFATVPLDEVLATMH
jgi:hypothetical protein